jgi:hypothetical protein
MPLNFDPSADFAAAIDGLETVTLKRRGSSEEKVITHALRRALTTREARARNRYDTWKTTASGGRLAASDVTWHLPTEQLNDSPRLGDVIVDSDACRWTILDVQLTTLETRWQCVTRNLAVAYGLDDTITVLKASYDKGAAGAAEPTWRLWKTGIRARIQVASTDVAAAHHARHTATRFRIFLEEDLALDHTHCIRGPDGTIYKINGTTGAERIDELQSIDAEALPQPPS